MTPLRVLEVEAFERDVRLRMPFRFGVVTLTEAPQAFARVLVKPEGLPEQWGCAAELLAPKWFDKTPGLSNQENFEQLRRAVRLASAIYLDETEPLTAFQLFSRNWGDLSVVCAKAALNPLIAAFAASLLDRAVLDALLRASGASFPTAIRGNLPGLEFCEHVPDLRGFDFDAYLATLTAVDSIQIRHTVGLADQLSNPAGEGSPDDGLPVTLQEVVQFYGNRYFKIKASGDLNFDLARFGEIAAILDGSMEDYSITLDGNEQFQTVRHLEALLSEMRRRADLGRFLDAILWIEQPLPRSRTLVEPLPVDALLPPLIIDESDALLSSFATARRLGYAGVSSKACKGVYRSLLNGARCVHWNQSDGPGRYFLTGEDLTTQAGLAVQHDLALASLLGIRHVEKNGHHYVRGMEGAPLREQLGFLASHPDLYVREGDFVRLNLSAGAVRIKSLACPGFASKCDPDWDAMREMPL